MKSRVKKQNSIINYKNFAEDNIIKDFKKSYELGVEYIENKEEHIEKMKTHRE